MLDQNHAEVFVDYEYHQISEEVLFNALDIGANIQAATPKLWYLLTGAKPIRIVFNVEADAAAKVEIFEGSTVTVVGTPVTPLNRVRASVRTHGVLFYKDPTVTVNGTTIDQFFIGAGGNGNSQGSGSNTRHNEWILKPSTKYVIKVTVAVNGTNAVSNNVFYEQ